MKQPIQQGKFHQKDTISFTPILQSYLNHCGNTLISVAPCSIIFAITIKPRKCYATAVPSVTLSKPPFLIVTPIIICPSTPPNASQLFQNHDKYFKLLSFLIQLFLNESKKKDMLTQIDFNDHLNFHKIHFTVRKRVRFGQAVYVCGDREETGCWRPEHAYRLKWNEGDLWTGSLLLTHDFPESIRYKYIISNWDSPSALNTEWEIGFHDRQMDLSLSTTVTLCDDKWNMDRICLFLLAAKPKRALEQKFYVTGDINQLGNWKEKKLMKKVVKKNLNCKAKKDALLSKSGNSEDMDVYTYSFYTFRGREQIYYYYIKKGDVFQSERKPGRVLKMEEQEDYHPYRRQVCHSRGEIVVVDQCNINELIFSQVTGQIYVGSFVKSSQDVIKLKKEGITGILSIQSDRDFARNGLTPHYINLVCEQQGIDYRRYSIEDMNSEDFVSKAEGAVRLMKDLLSQGNKIYVHCSAGIYRSTQIIALYLNLFQSYSVEEAVALIKIRHLYAKPSIKVINDALKIIQQKQSRRRLVL